MDAKEELFERFGKELVERVRDYEINIADWFLDGKLPPILGKYKDEINKLSPGQIEFIRSLAVLLVDGTLHDFLFMLESADWIKLRLESENTVLEDIREVERGDLQGYIFIWAEKYSKTRLTPLQNDR